MADDVELINDSEMVYEKTSGTINVESLKIHSEKHQKRLSMAKMCSFFQPTMYESFGSGTSDNKLNKDLDET